MEKQEHKVPPNQNKPPESTLTKETILDQCNHNDGEKFTQPSEPVPLKVTVSLPKHAASKLHDLIQKQDDALLRLGIISVQFEDDQVIQLAFSTTTNSVQSEPKNIIPLEQTIIGQSAENCNNNCIDNLNTTITLGFEEMYDNLLCFDESLNFY